MICNNCGKNLPKEGAVCVFCGAMMSQEQIKQNKEFSKEFNETNGHTPNLLSDRYGVNKTTDYRESDQPKENKLLGAIAILVIVLFLVVLAIILNVVK